MHDAFEFNLKETNILDTIDKAFHFMNYLGYNILYYKGKYLDIMRFICALADKFGRETTVEYMGNNLHRLIWKDEEKQTIKDIL